MQKIILSALLSASLSLSSIATDAASKPTTSSTAVPTDNSKETKSKEHKARHRLFHNMSKEEITAACTKAIAEAKSVTTDADNKVRVDYHTEMANLNLTYISKATNDRDAHLFGRRCMREAKDAKRMATHKHKSIEKIVDKSAAPKEETKK